MEKSLRTAASYRRQQQPGDAAGSSLLQTTLHARVACQRALTKQLPKCFFPESGILRAHAGQQNSEHCQSADHQRKPYRRKPWLGNQE